MTSLKCISVMTTCSVFGALLAIIFQALWTLNQLNTVTLILTGLLALENVHRGGINEGYEKPKVAVGYGGCADLVVNATQLLSYPEDGVSFEKDELLSEITDEKKLIDNFAHYFENGAASERFISDDKLFKRLLTKAKTKLKDSIRWTLGGNAPMMGVRFLREGADVLLATRMSEKLRKHLPTEIQLVGDVIDEDDIHMILEYKTGETWGPFTAPRANRFIVHNDHRNPFLQAVEWLEDALKNFQPRLLVVSGIQMMDTFKFEPGVREARIEKVKEQMIAQPRNTLIHFEMASYVEKDLLSLIEKNILPYTDSIGMNEQEVANLNRKLSKDTVASATDSNPRVAHTLDLMREVFVNLRSSYASNSKNKRPLTRMHVHTLAYQVILIVKGSQWNNTKNAAAKAALTAHRHVCANEVINPESAMLILDSSFATTVNELIVGKPQRIKIEQKDPVSCWSESVKVQSQIMEYEICVAPVLVCRDAKQTAGAGDNISASGLVVQI